MPFLILSPIQIQILLTHISINTLKKFLLSLYSFLNPSLRISFISRASLLQKFSLTNFIAMASKKSVASGSSFTSQPPFITQLIRDQTTYKSDFLLLRGLKNGKPLVQVMKIFLFQVGNTSRQSVFPSITLSYSFYQLYAFILCNLPQILSNSLQPQSF